MSAVDSVGQRDPLCQGAKRSRQDNEDDISETTNKYWSYEVDSLKPEMLLDTGVMHTVVLIMIVRDVSDIIRCCYVKMLLM